MIDLDVLTSESGTDTPETCAVLLGEEFPRSDVEGRRVSSANVECSKHSLGPTGSLTEAEDLVEVGVTGFELEY